MIQITEDEYKQVIAGILTASQQIDMLNQLLASKQQPQEQPPQKKKVEWEYKMEEHDEYYRRDTHGVLNVYQWKKDKLDHYLYKMDNCFLREAEAKAKKEYDLLFADYCEQIRQTNEKAGLVLDWGDTSQSKTYICYHHYLNTLNTYVVKTTQNHSDKEYWLIPPKEILPLCREYFTDTELKAIATKNHKLLMEGK